MELAGVADVAATSLVNVAQKRSYAIFAANDDAADAMRKAGLTLAGNLTDGLRSADLVVDTSPKGITARNAEMYRSLNVPFIVNGGEEHELTGHSFSALANYRETLSKQAVRVVSCNTTALCRVVTALKRSSVGIADIFATIIRRAADPVRTKSGPVNAIVPVLGGLSHHAPDVLTVIPDIPIASLAAVVSSTLSHVHMVRIQFKAPVDRDTLLRSFKSTPRIVLVSGERGIVDNAHVLELHRDLLRPRGDMWEVAIWEDSVYVEGNMAVLSYCVHMESIAVPENVDAIRAMLELERDPGISIRRTDEALGCYREDADYGSL
jgi:glyceraldehyde-3-phosphate dehydrogenase (NAD(P))